MLEDPTLFDAIGRVLTGLSEYTITAADETPGGLRVSVIATRQDAACPGCGEFSDRVKALRAQGVRDVPHAGRAVLLCVVKRSFRCPVVWCERRSFTQHTDEITARRRTTTRCREQMGRAGKNRSTASVAVEFGVTWSTAWAAIRVVAQRELAAARPALPTRLGIDETRFWWREPWLTGIVDLDSSDLYEMICGRSAKSLGDWIVSLTAVQRASVTTVVIDMHAGYRAALRENLPAAVVIADRFHVEQLTGRAVTAVRRRRIWEQAGHRGRKTDKGWKARHDLLRHPDRLTVNGWSRVAAAMRLDAGNDTLEGDLLWAWAARQYLSEIYATATNRAHAHRMIIWWYCFIADHPVPELVSLATSISAWETEILNYFDHRLTNGRTEGRNRTIKHVKRVGYGYRSTPNYTLKCRYNALRVTSWTTPANNPVPR
jgi:transposase